MNGSTMLTLPERIREMAKWMNSCVQITSSYPDEPPGPATEFDFVLGQDAARLTEIAGEVEALIAERDRLNAIVNTPQADDFLRAVSTEAEHQRQRWGSEHDAGKTPADWFWLVGYLGGKALHAHTAGNVEKAEHHVITTAAALKNWHLAISGKTDMRPGIDGDAAIAARKEQQP